MRKKEEAAKEKAAKKAAEPQKAKKASAGGAAAEDELDASKYTDLRRNYIESLRKSGENPYPHKFNRSISLKDLCEKFDKPEVAKGTFIENEKVLVTGRIMTLRAQGAKLVFMDLVEGETKVQIFAPAQVYASRFFSRVYWTLMLLNSSGVCRRCRIST